MRWRRNKGGSQRRTGSLYRRQVTLTAGMVLMTLLLLGASFFALTYTYIMTEKQKELTDKAVLMADLNATYLPSYDTVFGGKSEGMQIIAKVAASLSDVDFLIWDLKTDTILSTDTRLEGMSVAIPQEISARILEGETYLGETDLALYRHNRLVSGVPVYSLQQEGEILGVVLAITDMGAVTEMWRVFLGIFLMTSVTVILIAFIASSVTAMEQTKPIYEMVDATRNFALGNFETRLEVGERTDELGELQHAFNVMAESLQKTELERQDFIANISHELKTPMTTITGYADAILDRTIPPETEQQYLRIISDESKRLNRLVRRMLEISRLQTIDEIRDKRPFDIAESIRVAIVTMEQKIVSRQLDVAVELPEDPVVVLGDCDLITQVVYNLLENAIKFATPQTTLCLEVAVRGEKAYVTIANHGETIPAEEIPRLFERFHKADRSRSRDKDGVGLGLYIVKTILHQQRETIQVTSENGLTSFCFTMTMAPKEEAR